MTDEKPELQRHRASFKNDGFEVTLSANAPDDLWPLLVQAVMAALMKPRADLILSKAGPLDPEEAEKLREQWRADPTIRSKGHT